MLHPLSQLEQHQDDPLQRFVLEHRDEILRREPGVQLGADPEELHKQRVATRRLRSLLRTARSQLVDLPRAERLREELSWLGGVLGEVRDRDVLIAYLLEELSSLEEAAAFGAVLELLDGERDEARREVLIALDSPRYKTLLDELSRPPSLSEGQKLESASAREYKRLGKAVRALGEVPSDAQLHRVRIRVKRTRYAAEAVGAGKRFVARAKALQDVLGEHQDAAVAESRIRELVAQVRGTGRTALAAGRLIERQRLRRAEARKAWPRAWKRLERAGDKTW